MLTLGCKVHLKTPCHIGYGEKGAQVLDDRNLPYIPSCVLRVQLVEEASRFATSEGMRITPALCTDALVLGKEKVKVLDLRGKEYFKGTVYFQLKVKEKDARIYLAGLRSLQNAGLGAGTSYGFGYSSILIVEADLDFDILEKVNRAFSLFAPKERFFPPHPVQLPDPVGQRIKKNWRRWAASYNPGPFRTRHLYKVDRSKPLTRTTLRSLFFKITGIEHEKGARVCSTDDIPCRVCDLLGCPNHKSRIISRPFPDSTFLVCENLKEEERDLLEEALKKGGYRFLLQEKETLASYLK